MALLVPLENRISILSSSFEASSLPFIEKEQAGRHLAFALNRIKSALELYTKDLMINDLNHKINEMNQRHLTTDHFLTTVQEVLQGIAHIPLNRSMTEL